MSNNRKNAIRAEKQQKKIDEGTVSSHFPGVKKIIIDMTYTQKGLGTPLQRTLNFSSGSNAYFVVECLDKTCLDGGFDLAGVINSMVRSKKRASGGSLGCCNNETNDCQSAIDYKVAIKY
jgi:hypothetical protein